VGCTTAHSFCTPRRGNSTVWWPTGILTSHDTADRFPPATHGDDRSAYVLYTEALRLARVFHDEEGCRSSSSPCFPVPGLSRRPRTSGRSSRSAGHVHRCQRRSTHGKHAPGVGHIGARAAERPAAVQQLLRSSELARQVSDTVLLAKALVRLGRPYESTGDLRSAFQQYSEALRTLPRRRNISAFRIESAVRVANAYLRYRQMTMPFASTASPQGSHRRR